MYYEDIPQYHPLESRDMIHIGQGMVTPEREVEVLLEQMQIRVVDRVSAEG